MRHLAVLLLSALCLLSPLTSVAEEETSTEGGGVKSTIKETATTVGHGARETGGEMKEGIKDFGRGMKGAGKEVGHGFVEGAGEVKDTAKGLWNQITN